MVPLTHPLSLDAPTYVYDYPWTSNAAGIDFSNWYGFGRVNALNAVLMANSYTFPLGTYEKTSAPQTDEWYYDSGAIGDLIPEGSNTGTFGMPGSALAVNHNFFVESVEIEISITHAEPSDIGIVLTSPSGTESRLLLFNSMVTSTSFPAGKKLLTNAFYGEESLGNWKLTVLDGTAQGDTGTVDNWKIRINGHKVTPDGSNPDAPTAVVMAASFPSSSHTPTVAFTYATAIDVVRYEMSVGTIPGATDIAEWTSIGVENATAQLSGLTLTDNTTYYLNLRAVDNMENTSNIISTPWDANY
jgi:subtilisin-like proprotein convertase family protein